jgi:perosamine synthetase
MIRLSQPFIDDEEISAVERVLRSGQLSQGPEVEAFENEFSDVAGGRSCVAVNSGTSALHVAFLAIGVGPGDEVIVPSFTFAATANAVALTGARPVFVDIDPVTFCMDPQAVEASVTARTVAIAPVHLYGQPAAMTELRRIADMHGLLIVEDAAQAHLATYHGTPAGALGDVAAFSFYPTKNMTTTEGGMITAKDPEVERRCRLLRSQGMAVRYHNEVVGLNVRMTDVAAAIGRVQLRRLSDWTRRRRANAARFDVELSGVVVPQMAPGAVSCYHQYTVRTARRDELVEALRRRDIGVDIYYPVPVHRLPSFDEQLDLPETERACTEVCSIPVHPFLSEEDVSTIVAAVNETATTQS